MLSKNGSITDKINEEKKSRQQKRKEVMQDTAELKLLKQKRKRLQVRANGMTREQMVLMWNLWEEGDRRKQSKKDAA